MGALSYKGVRKTFGDLEAVKAVDLAVPEGEVFGLLGPNGAGKTTLIRMTLGIILPDEGTVFVGGEPFSRKKHHALFGYLPEERGLYPKMTVVDLLEVFGRLRGLSRKEARKRADAGLERFELGEWKTSKVEALSKGMQQKIQLLIALIHRPRIAILDEPFSGLDPVNVELLKEIIQEARADGTTVVLSTHQMEQVEQLCAHIALINKGEVVLRGRVDEIRRSYGSREVSVEFSEAAPNDGVEDSLVEAVRVEGNQARYRMREGVKARDVAMALLEAGHDVTGFREAQASMHDIFVEVVASGEEGDHA